jgi:dihydropyrimidine dehydrogenase (NADP+)
MAAHNQQDWEDLAALAAKSSFDIL